MASQNQNIVRYRERERGYCGSPEHGLVALGITPYLVQALRYALLKIVSLWHLVTLRDVSVRRAQECSSTQWDAMSLGPRFTQLLRANRTNSLIPQWMVREIWQLATLYWTTLRVSTSPEMALQNQNGIRSPKSERGYFFLYNMFL